MRPLASYKTACQRQCRLGVAGVNTQASLRADVQIYSMGYGQQPVISKDARLASPILDLHTLQYLALLSLSSRKARSDSTSPGFNQEAGAKSLVIT